MAVTEACSNIMKHAYRGRADQRIHLEAGDLSRQGLGPTCTTWVSRSTRRKSRPPALDGSQESGFGLYLITHSVFEFPCAITATTAAGTASPLVKVLDFVDSEGQRDANSCREGR